MDGHALGCIYLHGVRARQLGHPVAVDGANHVGETVVSRDAFKDIKVLDLSQGVAAPHCGWLLAQYGAEVVKVEPPGGDWIRELGVKRDGKSAYAYSYNAGKRSVALDLKSPDGLALVQRIAARCDVVIESFRPGVASRLGVGYEDLAALNPSVIYLSVSGYGQRGPWSERPCTDTVAQAFSGLAGINVGTNGVPHKLDMTIIDAVTGLYAFQRVTTALYARRDTGEGAHLDVSLMASAAALQTPKILEFQMAGGPAPLLNSPAGSYRAADGWLAIALIKEADFRRLCEALELESLGADPRFDSFRARSENHSVLAESIQARMSAKTRDEWMEIFSAHEVLAHPIHDYGEWLEHPQVRGAQATAGLPGADGVQMPRVPGLDEGFDVTPAVGEHSRQTLAALGLPSEEIDRLVALGVVVCGREIE